MYWKQDNKNKDVFSEFSMFDFSVSSFGGINLGDGQHFQWSLLRVDAPTRLAAGHIEILSVVPKHIAEFDQSMGLVLSETPSSRLAVYEIRKGTRQSSPLCYY